MITRDNIIDAMLATIGEGGVSTLYSQHPSVLTAKRILDTENTTFQTRGWWFNTEYNFLIVPDQLGRIELPTNTLLFEVTNVNRMNNPAEKIRYAQRGTFVYDTYLHTNEINTSLAVNFVQGIAINDMPAVAANYLKAKAEERMYVNDDGDPIKTEKLERYRLEAWQMLRAQEIRILGANGLDSPISQNLRAGYNGGSVGSYIYGGGTR